jgi:hypothetical protein
MAKFSGGRTNLLEPLFTFPGFFLLDLVLEQFFSPYFIKVLLGFFVVLALETH